MEAFYGYRLPGNGTETIAFRSCSIADGIRNGFAVAPFRQDRHRTSLLQAAKGRYIRTRLICQTYKYHGSFLRIHNPGTTSYGSGEDSHRSQVRKSDQGSRRQTACDGERILSLEYVPAPMPGISGSIHLLLWKRSHRNMARSLPGNSLRDNADY